MRERLALERTEALQRIEVQITKLVGVNETQLKILRLTVAALCVLAGAEGSQAFL